MKGWGYTFGGVCEYCLWLTLNYMYLFSSFGFKKFHEKVRNAEGCYQSGSGILCRKNGGRAGGEGKYVTLNISSPRQTVVRFRKNLSAASHLGAYCPWQGVVHNDWHVEARSPGICKWTGQQPQEKILANLLIILSELSFLVKWLRR